MTTIHDAPQGARVTVINDDITQLKLLKHLLTRESFDVSAFGSAEEALDWLTAQNGPPDLIITDLHMPGIDGWRFCRLLRSPEYAAFNKTPILIVSATFSGENLQQVCAASGADAFLPLPVDSALLLRQVEALLTGQSERDFTRILVVENNQMLAEGLQKGLEAHGYRVAVAHDGQTARRLFEEERPKVVALDGRLPDTIGDALLEAFIREEPQPVVVMMTADPNPELALRWTKQGAAAYVRKPFLPEYLVGLCTTLLRERSLLHIREILDRRTHALRETEQFNRQIIAGARDGIIVYDREFKCRVWNSFMESLTSVPASQALGKDAFDLFPHLREQKVDELLQRTLSGETVYSPDIPYHVPQTGQSGWVSSVYSPHSSASGEIIGVIGIVRDVTERKRAEEGLRESEKAAQRLAHENAVMAEIGRIISSTLDIGKVYESFAEEAQKLITFDRISINLINLEEGKAAVSYIAGLDIPGRRFGDTFLLKGSVTEQIRGDRLSLLIQPETQEDLEGEFPKFIPHFQAGLRSMMGIPLIYGDAVIGVVFLFSRKLKAYTDLDLRLADGIGAQIAGAIANAKFFLERKRAEEALRKTEERFRDLYNSAPVGYHEYDTEGRITNVNHTDLEMLGYSQEEMIGQYIWKFNVGEDIVRQQVLEKLAGLRPPGRSLERTYRRKNGTSFPVLIEDRLNKDETGRITGIRCTIQDITERKETEAALRESEKAAQRLVHENAVMAEIGRIVSSTLNIEEVYERFAAEVRKLILFDRIMVALNNPGEATATVTYASGLEFEGRRIGDVFPIPQSSQEVIIRSRAGLLIQPETVEELEGRFSAVISTFQAGFRSIMTVPLISQDQVIGGLHLRSKRPKAYTERDLRMAERIADQIAGAIAIARLFQEQKRAEEALRKSEERFRDLYDSAPVGYHEYDTEGRITNVNRTNLEMLEFTAEEMIGQPVWKLSAEEETSQKRILSKLAGTLPPYDNLERNLRKKDGTTFPALIMERLILDEKGKIEGVRTTIQDITQRKQAEGEKAYLLEQLHQSQKMEAIGTLAGGIAHDFNNILAAILGFAELVTLDLEEDSKAKYYMQQSIKAAHRARDVVRQILAFSHQGKQERKPLHIKPLIKEGLTFLRASLPVTIEILQNMEEDPGTIEADPTHVHQVLVNLCTNAAHAMGEKGGGLEVSLSKVDIPAGAPATSRGIAPGPYVRLRVSDTGHGMPPNILKNIFDPYFTTKEVGKGSGLGLAVVHGIVKSYGGGITVSSVVGKGSTFDIYFPRIQAMGRPLEAEKVEPLPFGGHERVLFVDDEKAIAEIGQSMLKYLGYEVEVRTSSIEALELFRAQADRFDLVITDMAMPNMTGDKLAQELIRFRPGIPIILCTGYSGYITEEKAKTLGVKEFAMKPLVMKDLAEAIRRALGSQEGKRD